MKLPATTSQTVGPFFKISFSWLYRDNLAAAGVSGERVAVQGRVIDGDGNGVPDAIIEIWQANSHGKYAHPEDAQDKPVEAGFTGFGRIPTDAQGQFRFTTIKPGPVPSPDGKVQAPHLVITVLMRGLLRRLTTRMYFPGDALNANDPILNLVSPERRNTLIARRPVSGHDPLEWNLVLQGPSESVFFDLGL